MERAPDGAPASASDDDRALGCLAASIAGLLPPLDAPADAVAALLGAFGRNNFGVLSDVLSVVGAGCYPATALLNHSCYPTCVLAFDGHDLERAAAETEDLSAELALLRAATHIRRRLCHPLSARRYEAECALLTAALAGGDLATARACCASAVRFLGMALAHVPRHPLLALQRFTLCDLEQACAEEQWANAEPPAARRPASTKAGESADDEAQSRVVSARRGMARMVAAAKQMIACARAVEVSNHSRCPLRAQSVARLKEVRHMALAEALRVIVRHRAASKRRRAPQPAAVC